MVSAVEMKQSTDQKATQPKANCLAESEKNVSEGRGQVEETLMGIVVVGSLAMGDAEISLRRGSSIATQLLPVASESGYLHAQKI